MPLAPGSHLGRYEIRASIGAGGFGDVYRAHDPETGREVAIKVSSRRFDERFAREARVIASLNHPNICTLFDVGPDYLVMELVEGPTLGERIKQGAMPLPEALNVARQIAAALEYAHERPVIHRDLKPANIKIRPDGLVKVLDFGLAKVGTVAPSEDSPTLTMGLSEAGMILGTASYMSPEQARGLNVDKRADIWSFGVVLHEMLTGQRLFTGQTVPDILLSVISKPLDTAALPAEVRPLLDRCLERDVRKRLRDMGDMDLLLREPPPAPAAASAKSVLPWVAAAVCAAGVAALAWVHFREPTPAPLPVVRTQITPRFAGSRIPPGVVSPDGRWITLLQTHEDSFALFLRDLASGEERLVADSEGSGNISTPFWSPDSQWVAFFRDGLLRKAPVSGGRSQVIAEGVQGGNGSWGSRDIIVFADTNDLRQVPAVGGTPTPIPGTANGAFPFFLPDGKHFIHTVRGRDNRTNGEVLASLEGTERKQIADQAGPLLNAPNGKLYFSGGGEWIRELDTASLELTGPRFLHLDVPTATISTSKNGVLAVNQRGVGRTELSFYDRSGRMISSTRDDQSSSVDISSDGAYLAIGRGDLFLRDQTRGTETRFAPRATYGLFSPDGKQIVFSARRSAGNQGGMHLRAANGATQEQPLLELPARAIWPNDWSPDGQWLLYSDTIGAANMDLMALPMDAGKDRKPVPYIVEPASQKQAQFSPDGRFVAYASDESGRFEIYVRPFPDASAGKWTVSAGGGVEPRWNKDGTELYYFSGRKLMVVGVKTAGGFSVGAPKELFEAPVEVGYSNDAHHWQPAPDGRFLIQTFTESATSVITVITNWQELLKQ